MDLVERPPQNVVPITADWTLEDDVFLKWWSLLPQQDRDEFVYLHQGDTLLARFLCALDYLTMNRIEPDEEKLYRLAYAIAADLDKNDPAVKNRSTRARSHPAFLAIRDKLRHRTVQQNHLKIENDWASLVLETIEMAKQSSDIKERGIAANMAKEFAQMTNLQESRVRSERLKQGLAKARAAITNQDEMGPKEAEAMLKAIVKKLPASKVLEITSSLVIEG